MNKSMKVKINEIMRIIISLRKMRGEQKKIRDKQKVAPKEIARRVLMTMNNIFLSKALEANNLSFDPFVMLNCQEFQRGERQWLFVRSAS